IVSTYDNAVTKRIVTTTNYTCELEKGTAPGKTYSTPDFTQCSLYTENNYWHAQISSSPSGSKIGCVITCNYNGIDGYDSKFFDNFELIVPISSASSLTYSTYFFVIYVIFLSVCGYFY